MFWTVTNCDSHKLRQFRNPCRRNLLFCRNLWSRPWRHCTSLDDYWWKRSIKVVKTFCRVFVMNDWLPKVRTSRECCIMQTYVFNISVPPGVKTQHLYMCHVSTHMPIHSIWARCVHDDVIEWKHFLCYWPFVRGNSPVTKANVAGLWYFLWSAPEQAFELTMETPVTWDAIALIMTSLFRVYVFRLIFISRK